MSERSDLLESIADTIKDYRTGEVPEPTPDHVDQWIQQFDDAVQVPLLREIDHVFKKTYFSRADVAEFFTGLVKQEKLAGSDPCNFWRAAYLLDIQEHGHSQTEICEIFSEALKQQCAIAIEECGSDGGAFIYLDDVLFSGGRIGNDISAWIANDAPTEATVHIVVIATHHLGRWLCFRRLKKEAADVGKQLDFHCWAAVCYENRKACRYTSEVLWPTNVPDDADLKAYIEQEEKFPFVPRHPGGKLEHDIFSSEKGRQLLEQQLLLAGMRIRSFSQNPKRSLRPLGFSAFGLGFGSMIVTFRNCPNNSPLALWWGDPSAELGHPFRNWYPLLPRKTYAQEEDFDVFDF